MQPLAAPTLLENQPGELQPFLFSYEGLQSPTTYYEPDAVNLFGERLRRSALSNSHQLYR